MVSLLPEVIHKGSVKNVMGVKGQSPYVFEFSDRYSMFDWGPLPDHLDGKGEALAFMAWFFFDFLGKPENWQNWQAPAGLVAGPVLKKLQKNGLSHHSLGLVSHDQKVLPLAREVIAPSRLLSVRAVDVIHPRSDNAKGKLVWDYADYQARPENALVPLEMIFRFGVPEGSSLLKRAGDADYCAALGLKAPPKAGDVFETPVIEFSTKLEPEDRYVSYAEAQEIAGLSDAEFAHLKELMALVALRLKDVFAGIGIALWDGKFEWAFGEKDAQGLRDFVLVDSIGPDELRLMCGGVHLSKEFLRVFYRQTSWFKATEEAKKTARARGEKDWRQICIDELKSTPPLLPPGVKRKAEMVYKSICRTLSEKHLDHVIYRDAWTVDELVANLKPAKDGEAAA